MFLIHVRDLGSVEIWVPKRNEYSIIGFRDFNVC